ncbi:MAG: hypothetical protein ACRDH2_06910 [Anaerolineales bacterium]
MNDALGLTLFLILISLSLAAFFVVLAALFPKRTAQTRAASDAVPGRAFLVGLVNFLFFGALAAGSFALAQAAEFGLLALPGLIVLAALTVGMSVGLAGVAQLVGARLAPLRPEPVRTVLGALALGWACALPFVGWFVLLPYVALLGLGGFIVGLFYRERSTPSAGT